MITLARFILKGPGQAALVAATMAILGMMLLPIAWLSAAAIALVVLVNGSQAGARVMAYATVGSSLFAWLIFGIPQLALYFVLLIWLPIWLPAVVLKQTVSLANSLLLVTLLAILATLSMYLLFPGMLDVFRPAFDELVQQLGQQYAGQITVEQLEYSKELVLRLLPGLFASSFMFGAIVGLLLARWWQAVLFNPGGFAREFQALDLGKTSAVITAIIVAGALTMQSDMLNALSMVVLSLYFIQASALMHALVNGLKLSKTWLVVVYALVFFIPHVIAVLVLAAVADAFVDFRARLIRQPEQ